jgi:hypothetical protein
MGIRSRFRAKKNALRKRHNNQVKKGSGGSYPTIFIKSEIPEGVEFYKVPEGDNILDIIPFEVGGNMPFNDSGRPVSEEGELDYLVDVWVHLRLGGMNKPYVCPWKNFGKFCPVCTFINKQRLDTDDWKVLSPKRRSIYLIWSHNDSDQEKKGIQIFDSAHFFMEEKLDEIAKLPRGGGSIPFSDIDDGKSVMWNRKGSGAKNTQYIGHKFVDREEPIPEYILEQAFPLDSVINMEPDIDDMEKSLNETLIARGLMEEPEEPEEREEREEPIKKRQVRKRKFSKTTSKKKRPLKRKKPVSDDDYDVPF